MLEAAELRLLSLAARDGPPGLPALGSSPLLLLEGELPQARPTCRVCPPGSPSARAGEPPLSFSSTRVMHCGHRGLGLQDLDSKPHPELPVLGQAGWPSGK